MAEPSASPDGCTGALKHLAAFTARMAAELAAIRPLVVATRFDSVKTLAASRRVSATLTAYVGLEGDLRSCGPTVELASRVEALQSAAKTTLDQSLSASTRSLRVHRDAGVALFGLLTEVLALSEMATGVADSLGVDAAIATIAEGADEPVGSLPPLPTPTPRPTQTAVTTPRPPAAATVALPKLSVKIAGATSVKYFAISGSTPKQLIDSATLEARTHCGKHAAACVQPGWAVFDVVQQPDPRTGACMVTQMVFKPSYTVWIPRWTGPSRVYPELVDWWREVLDHIAWHEGQHIRIQNGMLDQLTFTRMPSCSEFQARFDSWMGSVNTAQDAFDAKERSWVAPRYYGPP
jgi:predicted secreted Zn-dependent protease